MIISKKEEELFSDSNYSLFFDCTNRLKKKIKIASIICLSIGFAIILPAFIVSIYFEDWFFLMILIPSFFPLSAFLPIGISLAEINEITNYYNEHDIENLFQKAFFSHHLLRGFSIIALLDFGEKRIIDHLHNIPKNGFYQGFKSDIILAKKYAKYKHGWYIDTEKANGVEIIDRKKIPVTKVYFVKEIPKGSKCIISNLIIHYGTDNILACPSCGNMAKGDLLQAWLEENNFCPICRERISIDDCPIVMVKEK
jgi:hypothetical protein